MNEKPSKITKSCPECKRVAVVIIEIDGFVKFIIKCPYCQNRIEVIIGQKAKISLKKIVVVSILILIGWWAFNTGEAIAEKENCSVYKTQAEAQLHYSKKLDRNGNHIACEHLP